MYQDIKINIIGIDIFLGFDTINRSDLLKEMETFFDEDERWMARQLPCNTTINIQFRDISREDVHTNI